VRTVGDVPSRCMATLVGFISPETDNDDYCIRQSSEAGAWVGRVLFPSFVVIVVGVLMLVRHRSVLRAMLQGARGGAPVENVAAGRRVVIGWSIAIVLALVVTGVAYVHMLNVIEDCV